MQLTSHRRISGFCSSCSSVTSLRHLQALTFKGASASLKVTTAWRPAHKEVTWACKSHAAQVIDMYLSPDTQPHTHTHACTHLTPTQTCTHSCSHSILHKPFLTFCPSAPEQPRGGSLRSRSSHHSVPEAAPRTVDGCCKSWKQPLTSTDDDFRSKARVDMKCACCFKMIDGTKAKTNYSLDDLSWQNKTICTHSVCKFCRHWAVRWWFFYFKISEINFSNRLWQAKEHRRGLSLTWTKMRMHRGCVGGFIAKATIWCQRVVLLTMTNCVIRLLNN